MVMLRGAANNKAHPVHEYEDGFVLIRGTEYHMPLQSPLRLGQKKLIVNTGEWVPCEPYCFCGWGDTTEKVETSLGTFYICRSRHGSDYEAAVKKYFEDMRIFLEYKNQLKLEI